MEIPNENVKRLYATALKVGKKITIDSYLRRFPSLAEKPKPEPVKEVPKPEPKGEDLNLDLKEPKPKKPKVPKNVKKSKR